MTPYISKHERARGTWVEPNVTFDHRGDHYGPDDLGDRCASCGLPMVAAMVEAEHWHTHPSCPEPEPSCRKCAGVDDRWHDRDCPKKKRGRRAS